MSLTNGNGTSSNGLLKLVLGGLVTLIVAAIIAGWNMNANMASIRTELTLIKEQNTENFDKLDRRLTYLERQERRR